MTSSSDACVRAPSATQFDSRAGPNGDLDGYLKENKLLSEREARSILVQLFAGLAYLAHPKRRVIHYDLKVPVLFRDPPFAPMYMRYRATAALTGAHAPAQTGCKACGVEILSSRSSKFGS
jgi:hypothetical protein